MARSGTVLALLLLVSGCRGATGVMLEVSTDIPCESKKTVTTAFTAGTPSDFQSRAPVAVTTRCDSAGKIGSLVLVPSGDESAALVIEVTTALAGKDPRTCGSDPSDCMVARRLLRYTPHELIDVPVVMRAACLSVTCASNETCADGRCVSSAAAPCASPSECGDAGAAREDAGSQAPDSSAADAGAPFDAGLQIDSAPTSCPADVDPGNGICCGSSWCVGQDCPSLCGSCEAMQCASHVCAEPGRNGKVKCSDP